MVELGSAINNEVLVTATDVVVLVAATDDVVDEAFEEAIVDTVAASVTVVVGTDADVVGTVVIGVVTGTVEDELAGIDDVDDVDVLDEDDDVLDEDDDVLDEDEDVLDDDVLDDDVEEVDVEFETGVVAGTVTGGDAGTDTVDVVGAISTVDDVAGAVELGPPRWSPLAASAATGTRTLSAAASRATTSKT